MQKKKAILFDREQSEGIRAIGIKNVFRKHEPVYVSHVGERVLGTRNRFDEHVDRGDRRRWRDKSICNSRRRSTLDEIYVQLSRVFLLPRLAATCSLEGRRKVNSE